MRLNRQTRLTTEGYYFLIVLAFVLVRGSMKEINLMLALAGMMVGAFYFNWLGARLLLRRIKARRILPDFATAGEPLSIEIELSSPHRATALQCEDKFHLHRSRGASDVGRGTVVLPQIAAKQTARAEYRVRFGRRGVYEFDPLIVISRFPFRLLSHSRRFKDSRDRLVVLPRLGRLTSRWSRFRRGADLGDRRVARRQGTTEGDFYGLRDWRPGDSRRWIHWRTSARRGSLMVRQFEEPRNEDLTLLIDLWRPAKLSDHDEENIELAVSFAATIVADACLQGGGRLSIAVTGQRGFDLNGAASRSLGHEIVQRLAAAEAASQDDWPALLAGVRSKNHLGRVVLISTRPPSDGESAAIATTAESGPSRSAPLEPLRIDTSTPELFEYFQLS